MNGPNQNQPAQETFRTTAGAILATAGISIGLGNVWRFPYMAGNFGGPWFVLVYLITVAAFGIPALMCEWGLGRHTRLGPMGAYERVHLPGGRFWGYLLALTALMASSYYVVVIGWLLRYWVLFATGAKVLEADSRAAFEAWLADPTGQFLYVLPCLAVACLVPGFGVRRGIERASRWIMPAFFVLFVGLVAYGLSLDGASEKLMAFLSGESSRFTPRTVLAAMGQALFSLGVGGTFMVSYGSYMRREENLGPNATCAAAMDVTASLLAGLLIIPAALVHSVELESGPSLLFVVLPNILGSMAGGRWIGVALLTAVMLAAMLSLIAGYEVVAAALRRLWGWSRRKALLAVFAAQCLLVVPAVASIGYIFWSDLLWGSTMQPVGAVVAVVALVWCLGRTRSLKEFTARADSKPAAALYWWMRYALPAGILAGLLYGWLG